MLLPHIFDTFFVIRMRAGAPHLGLSSLPALTELCPFCMTHGLELLILQLQDHWFIICASEPRIIELQLNYWICFTCSKLYGKTIKTLWIRPDKKYCLKLLQWNCVTTIHQNYFERNNHMESSQASQNMIDV